MGYALTLGLGAFALALAGMAPRLHAAPAHGLTVAHSWARATVPGQSVGAAYLELTSTRPITITGMHSDAAAAVEMHSMTYEGGVMRMRQLPKLSLSGGETVRLTPGGMHIMLLNLKRPLRAGDQVALNLSIRNQKGHQHTARVHLDVRTSAPGGAKP